MAEQLVAAADGEQDGTVVRGRGERLALARHHVGRDGALVAVLAAAEVDQVVGAGVDRFAGAGRRRRRSRSRATRSAAAGRRCCRGRRRCSSALDRGRGRAAPSGRSALEEDGGRADVVAGGRDLAAAGGAQARPALRRARASSRRQDLQPHLVDLLAQLALGGDRLPQAPDDDRSRRRRRRRAAGSSRSSRRPRGRREAGAEAASAIGRSSTIAAATRPPARRWAAAQLQAFDPRLGVRRRAAGSASAPGPARTRPRARSPWHRRPPPRLAARRCVRRERGDELRVEVESQHPVTAPREMQRDTTGAAAEVEDRPPVSSASSSQSPRSAS